MTEVAVRHDDTSLPAKIEWAKTMAVASLLPREYQGNPGNLLYAIEYADSLGIDRINAITSIHVINGKPSASADLIASLVRRAGHKLRITGDETHAVAQIVRSDDPDFTFEARWDVKKATAAGLWGKGNWRNYPGAMLRARAITEVARSGASDALYGVIYTPEELGADEPMESPQARESGRERLAAALSKTEPEAPPEFVEPDVIEGEVVEDDAITPDPITAKQLTALNAACSDLGLTREQKLAGVAATIGREVESTKDLTKDEATKCIKSLNAKLREQEAQTVVQDEFGGEPVDPS